MRRLFKRWWLWAGIVLLGLLATGTAMTLVGGSLINQANTAATKEQFDKIQVGMSEEEVEEILGPPTKKTRGWGTLRNGDHAPIVLPYYYAGPNGAIIKIDFYLRNVYAKEWINPGS